MYLLYFLLLSARAYISTGRKPALKTEVCRLVDKTKFLNLTHAHNTASILRGTNLNSGCQKPFLLISDGELCGFTLCTIKTWLRYHTAFHQYIDPLHVQEKSVNCPPTAAMLEDKRRCKLVLASAKLCYSSIFVDGRQPTKTYAHARYLNSQPTCNPL
jgi:hypothetical protein